VWRVMRARLRQGHSTRAPSELAVGLPDRYRGAPVLEPARCRNGCAACVAACPTEALAVDEGGPRLDVGRCLFCAECVAQCPERALHFSRDPRMATRRREDLVVRGNAIELASPFEERVRRIYGRSLRLRQVSAGGCNACEVDVNVLSTIVFDLSRFGIQFVASPRHADGLLVTGALTRNMRLALQKTRAAVPEPCFVIAVGACAISGGPYAGHAEVSDGIEAELPVDLYVPGCPPHPLTILDGLLRLLGRIDAGAQPGEA
jgi:Ni,Fe-hydrogenase III small subunit/ferredoxin